MTQSLELDAVRLPIRLRCLPPQVQKNCRLLILGCLPGGLSLVHQQYYGNPRNQFWTIMSNLVGADLPSLPYPVRLAALTGHRIGLWDCIGSAQRSGSLDSAIRSVQANPLAPFVAALPQLEAIAFNGAASARIGRLQLADFPHIACFDLPSSSPAYTLPLHRKTATWQVLQPFIRHG
ncbi:MAG: DNA-deoxyinosine glycosylase [Novosphingobium sp.]